jgi:uncharacterized protein YjbI with pentapeptide repeats
MPEPSDRDERPPPDWPVCRYHDLDGCIGIRIGTTACCFTHLEHEDPDQFKAFIGSLAPGAELDLRDTQLNRELLDQVLTPLKTDEKQPPIIGDASFRQAQFSGDVTFDGAQFAGASFREAQFGGDASFERVQFSDLVHFESAKFSEDAYFDKAQFSATTWFNGVQFSGDASFYQVRFDKNPWFDQAQFSGAALFDRTQFSEHAAFSGAQFSGNARFNEAQFTEIAWFQKAEFCSAAWFREAKFSGAQFHETQFSGAAGFDGAQFSGAASFERAQFPATTVLGPLRAQHLLLDGASFGASIVVEVAAAHLSMVGTRFEREARLSVRYADILLDRAAFGQSTSLSFTETPLIPSANPTNRLPGAEQSSPPQFTFEAPFQEMDLAPQPRLLSLRRVDVTNLVLGDLDLAWCLFRGAHNLDKLRIEGPKHFATSPKTWRWTERRTLAEEQQWRHTRHPNQGWIPPSDEALDWVKERSGQPVQQADPHHVAPLYRALRKAEEDAKYEPGAADFYYGEMEMRRHAHGTPWVEKWLLWAYWLVAGYGLRGLRALISLLVVVLGLAVLFQWIGFRGDPPAPWYWGSVLYAAKSTLSLPVQEQLTSWGEVLRILLRLTGPVLLGLALLSVRGRVKR